MQTKEKKILDIITPIAKEMEVEVVSIKLLGAKNPVVEILLDNINEERVSIDQCATFSRKISPLLDVNEILSDKYILEVGSAGINRPLLSLQDYERFKGKNIKIKTRIPMDNKRKFKGCLLGVKNNDIIIKIAEEEKQISFDIIEKGNLDINIDFFKLKEKKC